MNSMYIDNVAFSGSDSVSFKILLTAGNPLVTGAPAIDADLYMEVYRGAGVTTGSTYYSIAHDGFPSYELFRKDGALSYSTIYTFSSDLAGTSPYALFPPMEYGSHGYK